MARKFAQFSEKKVTRKFFQISEIFEKIEVRRCDQSFLGRGATVADFSAETHNLCLKTFVQHPNLSTHPSFSAQPKSLLGEMDIFKSKKKLFHFQHCQNHHPIHMEEMFDIFRDIKFSHCQHCQNHRHMNLMFMKVCSCKMRPSKWGKKSDFRSYVYIQICIYRFFA